MCDCIWSIVRTKHSGGWLTAGFSAGPGNLIRVDAAGFLSKNRLSDLMALESDRRTPSYLTKAIKRYTDGIPLKYSLMHQVGELGSYPSERAASLPYS